jgi:hypothetical protein
MEMIVAFLAGKSHPLAEYYRFGRWVKVNNGTTISFSSSEFSQRPGDEKIRT